MKNTKGNKAARIISALLATVLLGASCFTVAAASVGTKYAYEMLTDEDALHTSGTKLINKKGEEVRLRGVNLGGWLIQEDWFCPTSNNQSGDWITMKTLTERFGVEKTYELFDSYQDNWITEVDFKNLADMGYNCVRIPFWYRNFQTDDNGTWRLDENGNVDLSRLEWAVEMCRKYGIYAILDFHGANGGQGYVDHCGRANYYHFFDIGSKGEWYRSQACEIWSIIAERFKGDPAIAMFDLLNEPTCNEPNLASIRQEKYCAFYDDAYKAIREKDPTRIVSMIGVWTANELPKPSSKGWTGVVYQLHFYDPTKQYFDEGSAKFLKHNVPVLAGEFHPMTKRGITACSMEECIDAFEGNGVNWTAWTYKGMCSWAEGADWFIYASNNGSCTIDAEHDSFETLMAKWGSKLRTDSGLFKSSSLYNGTKKYLSKAPLDSAPMNTQADVEKANEPLNVIYDFIKSILAKISEFFKSIKNVLVTD